MAESPIENFVKLIPGKPVKLHFREHKLVERQITDPLFKVLKTVRSLLFLVDEVDGRAVDMTYSVVSEKLASDLAGYLEGKRYRAYTFEIVKDAPGTVPPRIVSVTPR